MDMQDIDHDCAAAIVELLRNDVEGLANNGKGKQKAAEMTDSELALQIFLEELNLHGDSQEGDLDTRSVSSAHTKELLPMEAVLNEVAHFAFNRGLVVRFSKTTENQLEITPDLSHHSLYSVEFDGDDLDDDVYARVNTRKLAEKYHLRNPPRQKDEHAESSAWAASRKPAAVAKTIRCAACSDDVPWFDTLPASCGDNYCADCLTTLFASSMTDESLYPPRCCRQAIPFERAKHFLTPDIAATFADKREELDTKNRVYCHQQSCSAFIPPANIGLDVATCPKCESKTCTMCKAAQHGGDCPEDEALKELITTANAEGWQRCFVCSRMVELEVGCNHMTCVCSAEFCYVCAAKWKTCECEQWDEQRLLNRAQLIAGRRDNPRRRLFEPPAPAAIEGTPGHLADAPVADPPNPPANANNFHELLGGDYEGHREPAPAANNLFGRLYRGLWGADRPVIAAQPAGGIDAIIQNLRINHECEHKKWKWIGGSHACEECHRRLPHYIFECRQCDLRACWRCRKNRL